MKQLLKKAAALGGAHVYTAKSLPTGVNWLHDIRRSGSIGSEPTFLDVGANIGQTVAEICKEFPSAAVHAFEPFSVPYAALVSMAGRFRKVTPVPLAMGAQAGRIEVRPNECSVLNTLRQVDAAGIHLPAESVRIGTIDSYCQERGLHAIDVLKTDTEGYDLEVLRGAADKLRKQEIGFVYSEVTLHRGNTQNTPFQPVFDFLTDCDYRFLGLYETYPLHNFDEPNLFCNALFVSKAAFGRRVGGRSS